MPYAIINVYFDRIADKIHEHANRGGRTIIHCVCGISRAASITIAYLMKYKKMSLRSAHDFVLGRRACIRPNPGFWRQLQDYEKRLMGASQTHAVRREVSTNRNHNNNVNTMNSKHSEISIPIQIVNSATDSNNLQRQSRSGSVRGGLNSTGYSVSDYIVPSHGYTKPQSQQRYNSSNTYLRDYSSMMPNPSHNHRSASSTRLFDDFNALHSVPIPPKSEYVTYESSTAKGYTYPNGNHRSSLFIDSFNEPKYTSVKPSTYSTAYRSIIDRY